MGIKAGNKIFSKPVDIAETINEHLKFTKIAQVLAEVFQAVELNPEFYLETTNKSFSLQTPSTVEPRLTTNPLV